MVVVGLVLVVVVVGPLVVVALVVVVLVLRVRPQDPLWVFRSPLWGWGVGPHAQPLGLYCLVGRGGGSGAGLNGDCGRGVPRHRVGLAGGGGAPTNTLARTAPPTRRCRRPRGTGERAHTHSNSHQGEAGRSRNPNPSTHARTAHRKRWRAGGARTQPHTFHMQAET